MQTEITTPQVNKMYKLMFCTAVLALLMCRSLLEGQSISNSEFALIFCIMTAVFLLDALWLKKIFALFSTEKERNIKVDQAIQVALRKALKWPVLSGLLTSSLLTLYYAFFAKFEKQEATNEVTRFSYSKSSNAKDIYWIVAIAQLPTLPLIHILIENENMPLVAWGVTLLTVWSVIFYLAQVYANQFRPIELDKGFLKYRAGLSWATDIPLSQIIKARKLTSKDKVDEFAYFMSPLGSEKNIILEFARPIRFAGPLIFCKSKKKAAISLDCPESFLKQLALKGVEVG